MKAFIIYVTKENATDYNGESVRLKKFRQTLQVSQFYSFCSDTRSNFGDFHSNGYEIDSEINNPKKLENLEKNNLVHLFCTTIGLEAIQG